MTNYKPLYQKGDIGNYCGERMEVLQVYFRPQILLTNGPAPFIPIEECDICVQNSFFYDISVGRFKIKRERIPQKQIEDLAILK